MENKQTLETKVKEAPQTTKQANHEAHGYQMAGAVRNAYRKCAGYSAHSPYSVRFA